MTAKELLSYQIETIGNQLRTVLESIPANVQDTKLCAGGMSPKEIVEHLAEAYHAVIKERAGEKHEWGTFHIEDQSWDHLVQVLWALRQRAADASTKEDDELALRSGFDYIVAHDGYHIGQLAAVRIANDPAWDPYSIYR